MKVKLDGNGNPAEWTLTASEANAYKLPTPPRGKGAPGSVATLSAGGLSFDKRGERIKPASKGSKTNARAALRGLADGPSRKSERSLERRIEEAKRAISPMPADDPLTLYKIEQAKRAIGRA